MQTSATSSPRSFGDKRSTSSASATQARRFRSQTAAELDEYTWLVAGLRRRVLDAAWLSASSRHLPIVRLTKWSELGIAYGKGLQLINVLRDRGADRAAGRNYLPAEELAAEPEEEVFNRWLEKATKQVDAGIEYAISLTNWRVRFATALPALIGARTLALLRAASPDQRLREN